MCYGSLFKQFAVKVGVGVGVGVGLIRSLFFLFRLGLLFQDGRRWGERWGVFVLLDRRLLFRLAWSELFAAGRIGGFVVSEDEFEGFSFSLSVCEAGDDQSACGPDDGV